ncbi:hypothetical protein [Ruficoccus sp. ZRK36]|uniref:energy transducer TonB n=1 Tax=Ruficoccus sp. ZRK36 TaxID=2866311 RepID=UPI001C73D50C|nr:hypothetical protein [Ruficoccus sp. ZRK36]QYY36400.1 hypothetical protein K0V07_02770 [Ruficoccus sp. ZRK36]
MDTSFISSDAIPLIALVAGALLVFVFALCFGQGGQTPAPGAPVPGQEMESGLPRVAYLEPPVLPSHLEFWGIRPETVLRFTVSKTGKATNIKMVRTTHLEVVAICTEAVRRASFLPLRDPDGEAVEAPMVLTLCPVSARSLKRKPRAQPAPSLVDAG